MNAAFTSFCWRAPAAGAKKRGMDEQPKRAPQAGGAIIAGCIIAGVVGGVIVGQSSIGFLVGIAAGVTIAILYWLRSRG